MLVNGTTASAPRTLETRKMREPTVRGKRTESINVTKSDTYLLLDYPFNLKQVETREHCMKEELRS